jgi:hypothetical protein
MSKANREERLLPFFRKMSLVLRRTDMADDKKQDFTPTNEPSPREDKAAEENAKARVKRGEGERPDETIPGGRYKVGDQIVDANGEPIKE